MRWALVSAAALLCSCRYFSLDFSPPLTPSEVALEQEVRAFYVEIQQAFVTGNADDLAGLYSPSITHPMTQEQILNWGRDFFSKNGRARFHILSFSFDKLSFVQPVVTIKYSVETTSGQGNFAGTETDTLVQRAGRWYIASWEKAQ